MPHRVASSLAALTLAFFSALLVASGCDTSFDRFQETDLAYSVWGYLDLHADTQWVRVEPLQDSSFVGSGPFEARVTSVNLATGEQVVWRDSVFAAGETGVTVHNFYTAADLEPGATYRLTVEGPPGRSTAEVTLPPSFPQPTVLGYVLPDGRGYGTIYVIVRGVDSLGAAMVNLRYDVCQPPPEPAVEQRTITSYLSSATRQEDGSYRITIPWKADILQAWPEDASICAVHDFRVSVASVSEDWPDYELPVDSLRTAPQPPAGAGSNIENGVGFLGGAATWTVDVLHEN